MIVAKNLEMHIHAKIDTTDLKFEWFSPSMNVLMDI